MESSSEDELDLERTYVPTEAVKLSPEQEECPHMSVTWDGFKQLFTCKECGGRIVVPDLAEALGFTCTE